MITSKQQYYQMPKWFNVNRSWDNFRTWEQECHGPLGNIKTEVQEYDHWTGKTVFEVTRLWGIRSAEVAGGIFMANVPTAHVGTIIRGWKGKYDISPMLPDQEIIFQGEVYEGPELYLFSSPAKLHMRQALRERPEHRSGFSAQIYLKTHLPLDDYEDIMLLLELYPGHVVEFGVYNVPVGTQKRRTVIWELRGVNY